MNYELIFPVLGALVAGAAITYQYSRSKHQKIVQQFESRLQSLEGDLSQSIGMCSWDPSMIMFSVEKHHNLRRTKYDSCKMFVNLTLADRMVLER